MLTVSCKPGTPGEYIQPKEMEDILVDYHIAKALAQYGDGPQAERDYNSQLYLEAVLRKHNVTQADFDSSLIYYCTRAERFDEIYQRVSERLEEQALSLGASESEVGMYAQYDATGDTANIWSDRTVAAMMPLPPYNRWEFSVENDSLLRRGDAFLMQFVSDFMYQSGTKNALLYVAVEFEDTIIAHHINFSVSGLSQMRIAADNKRNIKRLRGYFYLGDGGEKTTTVRLLFLDNVQLIRFHTLSEADILKADSLARDSIRGRFETDSLGGGDSLGSGSKNIPVDSGATTDRVPRRLRMAEP